MIILYVLLYALLYISIGFLIRYSWIPDDSDRDIKLVAVVLWPIMVYAWFVGAFQGLRGGG